MVVSCLFYHHWGCGKVVALHRCQESLLHNGLQLIARNQGGRGGLQQKMYKSTFYRICKQRQWRGESRQYGRSSKETATNSLPIPSPAPFPPHFLLFTSSCPLSLFIKAQFIYALFELIINIVESVMHQKAGCLEKKKKSTNK